MNSDDEAPIFSPNLQLEIVPFSFIKYQHRETLDELARSSHRNIPYFHGNTTIKKEFRRTNLFGMSQFWDSARY